MTLQDTPELRRLVHVADQRRTRYCALPVPSTAQIEDYDPCVDEMHDRLDEARVAMMGADRELIDYLLNALGMRSELRSK